MWGVEDDFGQDGTRDVEFDNHNLPKEFAQYQEHGWHIPPAPRRQLSLHQMCMRLIGKNFSNFVSSNIFDSKRYLLSLFPRLTAIAMEFIDIVDRSFLATHPGFKNEIIQKVLKITNKPKDFANVAWKIYQSEKQLYKNQFKSYMERNKEKIFRVCNEEDLFVDLFDTIDFKEEFLDNDDVPTQEYYDNLVEASKNKALTDEQIINAKVELADIRATFKDEFEQKLKVAKDSLINHIFTTNVDAVQGNPSSPNRNEIEESPESPESP